ncbi:hypothetical protein [Caballeronia sp. LZ035]|uniref:hypothetical protein n=1 Tax=Caballeronia sp. LZ035 TaxID=3038568 RepID=UPI00286C6813|nr:hypothetical protein [Caballeronia sp. LZ035]
MTSVSKLQRSFALAGSRHIAVASSEQRTDIVQLNLSIAQLDRATEQNASLVEEAAAAIEEQAQRLRETAAVFCIV